jgi:predicted O-methyltransferase YrrM
MGTRLVIRRGLSAVKRSVLRPRRKRVLDTALRGGLPRTLQEPLRYFVTRRAVDASDRSAAARVESLREALIARGDEPLSTAMGREFPLRRFARETSVDPAFGTFLYLCAKASRAKSILELGACVGISGAYLASAGCDRFVSIEGSPDLAAVARATVRQVKPDADVVAGLFDDALPGALESLEAVDLAWIDGHHEKDPTLRYFATIRPYLRSGALVLFDDISWSPDMQEAWRILETTEGFADTLDLGRIGLAVWEGGTVRPHTWDMTDLVGGRPAVGDRPATRPAAAAQPESRG